MGIELKQLMDAARLMKRAHAGQTRKHGTPYWKHPMAVCRILWEKGTRNRPMIQAALLHDVLENSPAFESEVKELVGPYTMALIRALTHNKEEPLLKYYMRLKGFGGSAMAIKMADRIHNNSELHALPPDSPVREKALEKTKLMETVFGVG
jgi:(p)ppGpp synthase/HD superfamily hydrolase